jgi:hypothetical protein
MIPGYLLIFEAAANFIPHVHAESLSFSILVYVIAIPIRESVTACPEACMTLWTAKHK